MSSELSAQRQAALEHLARLRSDHASMVAASESSNADDEHDPEGATIAFERQQLSTLIAEALRRVEDLDAALERLGRGSYGTCATCSEPIGAERLEARPSARTCITCARACRGR